MINYIIIKPAARESIAHIVQDGYQFRANAFLLDQSALSLYLLYYFIFLPSTCWVCGVVVFRLTELQDYGSTGREFVSSPGLRILQVSRYVKTV